MATTIQDLEERVNALYNSVLQLQTNLVPVTNKADNASNIIPQVNTNTSNIVDNTNGLVDIAEVTDENVESLVDLADIVAELDERVTALEEKEA